MQRQILFKCPRTGVNVQHRLDKDRPERAETGDTYVSVRCPACMAVHFVNSISGRLLGDRSGQSLQRPA
ncbi:hypothetical protein [Bradyrhizobium ottawaense]|uniref:Uncharacterized protein n=1 Tax=Bradyrhizobium ottawaense TaxID=931866 RepID=A0A2U8PGI3_9BRAD|nr:hypothetical protein [Bradyrhizobium ottawaense]AWL96871.1 hypothetical protein CIT37_35665 [Bradyrhizobium ottawaense]MBR1325988.1 hypothetical protein [Bradyrhizobium ottawaense]